MTIKIKAPIVMLTQTDVDIDFRERRWLNQKQFRAVSESDWRKLMRLVRAVEACDKVPLDVCRAIVGLKGKKK